MTFQRPKRPHKRTKKDSQREATRARLLDAARRLFSEHGYEDVSVTEIAREAGVTHGSIAAHFHAKAGLLYAIVAESNEAQIERSREAVELDGKTLDRLRRLVEIWAEGDAADPVLLSVMEAYFWQWPPETEVENRAQLERVFKTPRAIIQKGIEDGELRADLDIDRLIKVLFATYTLGLRPAIYDNKSPSDCADEISEQYELILEGARATN